jgi:hypothetical protein
MITLTALYINHTIYGKACDGKACDGKACDGKACDGKACDGKACDGKARGKHDVITHMTFPVAGEHDESTSSVSAWVEVMYLKNFMFGIRMHHGKICTNGRKYSR